MGKATHKRLLSVLCVILGLLITTEQAHAVPLIRDAEIEHTLRTYANPIFRANGLKPSAVKIFIVNDDVLNAYVAGGSNMFLYTGLIKSCPTADMLLGVIAHETGHISGGHLAQGTEKLKNAELGTIMTFVLGAAAAAASGSPDVAAAVITGGQSTVARNFLAFTRAHEEAADQSALNALDKLNISASGMVKMFELLRRHDRERSKSRDPYLLTHPLTNLRIEHVRNHVEKSKIPEGQYPSQYELMHKRMIAKLYGFLETPERTLMKYPLSDKSVAGRMARAIAYYKMPDLSKSMQEMESLLAEYPNDPFFHELKGQILFENNRVKESLASYQRAVQLLPDSALILAELARVEMAENNPALYGSAIKHLEKSVDIDNTNPSTWRLLATAYGKAKNDGLSALALAEEAILIDDPNQALSQLHKAIPILKTGTPPYQRALDLKARALDVQRDKQKEKSPF
jgi:predicted Zn-dependent protease